MNKPVYQPQHFQDDEIDLFELAEKLWDRKVVITAITAIVTTISIVIALVLPPTWQSKTNILVAPLSSFSKLESIYREAGLTPIITANLDNYRPAPDEEIPSSINIYDLYHHILVRSATQIETPSAALDISQSPDQRSITIVATASSAENTAAAINSLIQIAHDFIFETIEKDFKAKVHTLQTSINQSISILEQQFLNANQVEQETFIRDIRIAENSNIPPLSQLTLPSDLEDYQFLLGKSILERKLEEVQKERSNYRLLSSPRAGDENNPLLPEVFPLAMKLKPLLSEPTFSVLEPVFVAQPAPVPTTPIKPKKKLIIALGIVLGGMLGVFIALIQIAIASRKEKLSNRASVDSMQPITDATFHQKT
ncbi:Wzz/FepE/Etk N-terminal domain-containing protein [Parendozoicomonas sp. Alg238-R29]|uniref:Wzz/FepE/Etk N-terminal domain-containing protein n=1 Tax=Parendozoicomonas sp. Alg238-R29 TaxID=2993446 RepID=UPI00248DD340|nr:Wzz/FepE/Etk N-terminal domain-containing protein [Parendozoicomonas sp. Alg238-R29]